MASLSVRMKGLYGAGPWHVLAVLTALALAAYTLSVLGLTALWDAEVWWQSILVWFLGAVIVHDLVIFPLYALADRILQRGLGSAGPRQPDGAPRLSALNYFRVPALASGLLLLLFFPGIIEQGASSYARATGQSQEPFLERWLLLTGVFFGASAVLYCVSILRMQMRIRTARRS